MHILILSWRDIKNPLSGGAEIFTHQITKRLVKQGIKVSIISGKFPEAKKVEVVDGVKIIRPTHFNPKQPIGYIRWPLFLIEVAKHFKSNLEKDVDIVIDQVHGLPSFTTFYSKKPTIFFPLEVANEIWFKQIPFPANLTGFLAEKFYLKLFKNYPFLTISKSTANDLKKVGVKNISIITPGISTPPTKLIPKTKQPSFTSLQRLTPMKRLEDTIQAFSKVQKKHPKSTLHVIGKGNFTYLKLLKELTSTLQLHSNIKFHGFVSDKKKYQLLSQSWALLSTSIREGWGLNVIEAASVGTPTIAYNIPGISDSVINNKTGMLTKTNTPQSLALFVKKFIVQKSLRKKLGATRQDNLQ